MSGADLAVLGGNGRVAQLLERGLVHFRQSGRVVVQARQAAPGVDWPIQPGDRSFEDLLTRKTPRAMAVLWGVTPGARGQSFDDNCALALRALDLAAAASCPHVILMSSSAVYGNVRTASAIGEDDLIDPANRYGAAKRAMELAALEWWSTQPPDRRPGMTVLRLANVVGCDMLGAAMKRATLEVPLTLDRFPDGRGPRRSYIGPTLLLQALVAVAAAAPPRKPVVLNLAEGRTGFEMSAILEAMTSAGHPIPWAWQQAGESANPYVVLDTSAFFAIYPALRRFCVESEQELVSDYLNASQDHS